MNWKNIFEKVLVTVLTVAMLSILGGAVGGMWSSYKNQQKMIDTSIGEAQVKINAAIDILSGRVAELEGNIHALRGDLAGHCTHETNWGMTGWESDGRKADIVDRIQRKSAK